MMTSKTANTDTFHARSINLKLDQLSKNVTKVDMLIKIESTSSPETYYQGNNIMKQSE